MRRTRVAAALAALVVGTGLLAACSDDEPSHACEAVGAELDWATPSRDDDERQEDQLGGHVLIVGTFWLPW